MQTPQSSDPSFKEFLAKLQEQNNSGLATQLVQLKSVRENAGEDNDKREEQLDAVILGLKEVRNAILGKGNSAKVGGKGALAAVNGKGSTADGNDEEDKSKYQGFLKELKSGFKFFMTDGLSEKPGYGMYQEPPKDVEKKDREDEVSSPRQVNPEADNITSTGEIEADAAKGDLEISKQLLETTKAQLVELKAIREALAPKTPNELTDEKRGSGTGTGTGTGEGGGGGGLGLGDLLPSGRGIGKTLKTAGRGLMTAGRAALPYAAAAGVAVAGGAAVDYGLGKLGVGKDKEGNDLQVDEKQDDANWAKMSTGEKIQSGLARGIEKTGSALFLGNMAKQAQSDRIKKESDYLNKNTPGAATKEALAPTPATVKSEAKITREEKVTGGPGAKNPVAAATPTPTSAVVPAVEPDVKFKRVKRKDNTIGGRVITDFEGGYSLGGKKEDVEEAEAAYQEFKDAKDDATAEAAASKFKTLAANIQSPEYQEKMKIISKAQQEKKKAKVDPAVEAQVTGGPGAKIPVVEKKPVDTPAPGQVAAVAIGADTPKKSNNKDYDAVMNDPGYQETRREMDELEARASDRPKKPNPYDSVGASLEARVAGGPVEDGADYIVGEKGPELFMPFKDGVVLPNDVSKKVVGGKIPLAEGGVALKDLEGKDLKEFQAYSRLRGQLESADFLRSSDGKDTYTDVSPEVQARTHLRKKELAKMEEALKTKGIDADAHYNRPDDPPAKKGSMDFAKYADARSKGDLLANEQGDSFSKTVTSPEAKNVIADSTTGLAEKYPELEKQYQSSKLSVSKESQAQMVAELNGASAENKDLERDAKGKGGAGNTVVSNNVSSNNTTKIVPMKANPRPEYTGSSLDRYTNRISVY